MWELNPRQIRHRDLGYHYPNPDTQSAIERKYMYTLRLGCRAETGHLLAVVPYLQLESVSRGQLKRHFVWNDSIVGTRFGGLSRVLGRDDTKPERSVGDSRNGYLFEDGVSTGDGDVRGDRNRPDPVLTAAPDDETVPGGVDALTPG